MCLIIETKKTIPISKKVMEEFASRNDDGFGFMWIENDVMKTEKYVDQGLDLLYDRYEALKEFEPIIHLRMKTHGLIDHTNTHPYPVCNGIFLMHNGVISFGNQADNTKSDTWHFIEDYIKPMLALSTNPHEMIRSPIFKTIIERLIGGGNRIVLGDKLGYVFFNELIWHTITEETTTVTGLKVSNAYAWNENFNKPKPQVSRTYTTPLKSTTGNQLVQYTKYSSYGLIEIDTDLFADKDGEIWEKDGSKYIRQGNVSKNRKKRNRKKFEREVAKGEAHAKKTKEEFLMKAAINKIASNLVPLPAPKIEVPTLLQRIQTMIIVPEPATYDATTVLVADDENDTDEHCEIVLPTDKIKEEYETFYYEGLEKDWMRLPLNLLAVIMKEEPDDAARLLHRKLRNV